MNEDFYFPFIFATAITESGNLNSKRPTAFTECETAWEGYQDRHPHRQQRSNKRRAVIRGVRRGVGSTDRDRLGTHAFSACMGSDDRPVSAPNVN